MHHNRPIRLEGPFHTLLAAAAILVATSLLTPLWAAADDNPRYQKLSGDAKQVVEATNMAIGGDIAHVCKNDLKAIHKKVFEVSNGMQKEGKFKGQGYYGLEARSYYSQRCRDFK